MSAAVPQQHQQPRGGVTLQQHQHPCVPVISQQHQQLSANGTPQQHQQPSGVMLSRPEGFAAVSDTSSGRGVTEDMLKVLRYQIIAHRCIKVSLILQSSQKICVMYLIVTGGPFAIL